MERHPFKSAGQTWHSAVEQRTLARVIAWRRWFESTRRAILTIGKMEKQTSIESKVASAILERKLASIEIEGHVYDIAPPSVATLILVSEIVSELPVVTAEKEEKNVLYKALHYAKDYRKLGELCAVLILGAKGITQTITTRRKEKRFFGLKTSVIEETKTIDRKAELAKLILENVRPSTMLNVIISRLNDMEIGDFFGITTSLSEANLLKPTREVG